MKNTNIPDHKQYCKVKYHRVSNTPEYLVKLGVQPTFEQDNEADEVWYNADKKAFYAGDEWFCDFDEIVYWKPSNAPMVGLAYK